MSLTKFIYATSSFIPKEKKFYIYLSQDLQQKKCELDVLLYDIPQLITEYQNKKPITNPQNPKVQILNGIPRVRLSSACHSAAHFVYSIFETTAVIANKSDSDIPNSFNKIRKKIEEQNWKHNEINTLNGKLSAYRKVREIRTEWTHYSAPFIGENDKGEPLLILNAMRRPTDRIEFIEKIDFSCYQFLEWIKSSLITLDDFAEFLLNN